MNFVCEEHNFESKSSEKAKEHLLNYHDDMLELFNADVDSLLEKNN